MRHLGPFRSREAGRASPDMQQGRMSTQSRSMGDVAIMAAALVLVGCGVGQEYDSSHAAASTAPQPANITSASDMRRSALTTSEPVASVAEVLDWAEFRYPELFPASSPDTPLEHEGVRYTVRTYPGPTYLGIRTDDRSVWGLGPFTSQQLTPFGPVDHYLELVHAQACEFAPRSALCKARVQTCRSSAAAPTAPPPSRPPTLPRWARVCPGFGPTEAVCHDVRTDVIGEYAFDEYRIHRPGQLLFELSDRRQELACMGTVQTTRLCSDTLAEGAVLPHVTAGGIRLRLREDRIDLPGATRVYDTADVALSEVRTSDGYARPTSAISLSRRRGTDVLELGIHPETVPGLPQSLWFFVDPVGGTRLRPDRFEGRADLSQLHPGARRMALGIAGSLGPLLASATDVGSVGTSPWSAALASTLAAEFSSRVFAMPRLLPVRSLTCGPTDCTEVPQLTEFRDIVQNLTADAIGRPGDSTRRLLRDLLREWSDADALAQVVHVNGNTGDFRHKYELTFVLYPVVAAWRVLRDDPLLSADERRRIEAWVDRRVTYATEPFGGPNGQTNPFNVGYTVAGLRMAWGVMRGDHVAFAEGVERFYVGLHQMRRDGSFPREVARGSCALFYQSVQTTALVYMAEVAAQQGYDLYALEVDGKTIHDAVRFIVDAVDDPSALLAYATTDPQSCGMPPGAPMDFDAVRRTDRSGRTSEYGYGKTESAWIEPYLRRFPNHPNAPRLRSLIAGGLQTFRPLTHPHAGGNTSCMFALE